MPVEQSLEGDLALVRCVGAYSTNELIGALHSLLANPDLPERALVLLDLRHSQSVLRRSIPDLRRITTTFGSVAARFDHRCALLVSGAARYGLMRMAAVWAELHGVNARVFRDEHKARSWLLRQPETAETELQ